MLADTAAFLPGVREIAARHGVAGEIARTTTGSMPVFTVGERAVLKLFAAPFQAWYARGVGALEAIGGRLGDGVVAPVVLGAGDAEASRPGGWTYVLMSRVAGVPLDELWPTLAPHARLDAAAAV